MDYSLFVCVHFLYSVPSHYKDAGPILLNKPLNQDSKNVWPQPEYNGSKGVWVNGEAALQKLHGGSDPCIVYCGIIDALQVYDMYKYGEHLWKANLLMQRDISAVSPEDYGSRFVKFMEKCFKSNKNVPIRSNLEPKNIK